MLGGLFEQGDEPVDFADGVLVRLRRAGGILEHGVDQHRDGLRHPIEDEQLVGDEEIHHRGPQLVVRRTWHHRFDVVNEFVADKTDRPARETRQSGHRDGAIPLHHVLDDRQSVRTLGRGGGLPVPASA